MGKYSPLNGPSEAPKDDYYFSWIMCVFIGVAQLFPFNALVTTVFNIPNIITLFGLTLFGKNLSVRGRLYLGYAIGFAALALIPTINLTHLSENVRLALTFVCILAMGASTALLVGTGFGVVANLPPSYTTALMVGQGLAGVLVGVIKLIMLFGVFRVGLKVHDPSIQEESGVVYFAISAVIMLLCALCNGIVMRTEFYKYYQRSFHTTKIVVEGETENVVANNESIESIENLGPPRKMHVFKKIWLEGLNVWLTFWITLSIFPGFVYRIPPYGTSVTADQLNVILVFLFQVFDFVGRVLPQIFVVIRDYIIIPCTLRLAFFPIFLLCVYTAIFSSNIYPYIFMLLFATSNGYFSTVAMMNGPYRVKGGEMEIAGTMMSFFLQLGVISGTFTSLALVQILDNM